MANQIIEFLISYPAGIILFFIGTAILWHVIAATLMLVIICSIELVWRLKSWYKRLV